MNEQYAIEPAALDDVRDLKTWISHFGFAHGRFVAAFPRDWRSAVMQNFSDEFARKLATRLLAKSYSVSDWVELSYDEGESWLDNAKRSRGNFSGAFCRDDPDHAVPHLALSSPSDLPSSRESCELEIAESFVAAGRPLLWTSYEIAFVDPYIDLADRRYTAVFRALLREAKAKGTGCRRFKFFSRHSGPCPSSEAVGQIKQNLKSILCSGQSAWYFALDDKRKIHDRCMVSAHGGLKFSRGFQDNGRQATDIHYLDPEGQLFARYVDCFLNNKHPFKVAIQVSIGS